MSTKTYRIPEGVVSRRVGDETVLMNLASDHYFGLNEIGTIVWSRLERGLPLHSIVSEIANSYPVDEAAVEADVRSVVEDMLNAGLLRLQENSDLERS